MAQDTLKTERYYGTSMDICENEKFLDCADKKATEVYKCTDVNCHKITLIGSAILIHFFSIGFGFSLSVLYPEFVRAFDSDRSIAALIQNLYFAFHLGGVLLWHPVAVRYGPAICIISGACVAFTGIFFAQFAANVWALIISIGVLGGVGASITVFGPHLLINSMMGKWKYASLAVIYTSPSLGQFFFSYVAENLIERYSWNGTLLITSGIMANLIPCGLIIYFIENDYRNKTKCDGFTSNQKLFDSCVFGEWRLYLLLMNGLLFAFAGFIESNFLVDFVILRGYDRPTGSLLVSYMGLTNFVGRIVAFASKLIYSGNCLLQLSVFTLLIGSSHVIILFARTYTGILSGALINGFSLGLIMPQLPIIMLEVYSTELFGPALSMWNISAGIGFFLCGYFGGSIEDLTNNYDLLFQLSIIFSLIMALNFLITGVSVTECCRKERIKYSRL